MYIASFDIGKRNFAFCVERVEYSDNMYSHEEIVLLKNVDLTSNTVQSKTIDPLWFINMNHILDTYKTIWDKCSYIIIEKQMGFGKNINYMALKLGQHCYSYFTFHYARFKVIIDFPAYHKTQILNAPLKMNKYQRKKWAVEKVLEILQNRDDTLSMQIISEYSKKDDLADVILQLQSFKYLLFVEKSIV